MWELLPKAVTVQSERRQRKGLTVVLWCGPGEFLQLSRTVLVYDPGVPCILYRVPGLGARAVLSVGVPYLSCPVSMRTVRVPYQAQTPHPPPESFFVSS